MENLFSDLARGATGSPGCGEDGGGGAVVGEEICADLVEVEGEEQQKRMEAWEGQKKQSLEEEMKKHEAEVKKKQMQEDSDWDDDDDKEYQRIVQSINFMFDEPIEGFDWDKDTIRKKTYSYLEKLNRGLPDQDDEFWVCFEEPELTKLNKRLALYRTRAYKAYEELQILDDAELRRCHEDGNCFVSYEYDRRLKWYFDPEYCNYANLQDYQRLMLRDYGEYEKWEYYREICSTLEGDEQFVQFWEILKQKVKWIKYCLEASRRVWQRFERVAYYHAAKIAAGFPSLFESLFSSGYSEYIRSVKFDTTWFDYYVDFYHLIWELVAKKKMDFKDALRQVYDKGIHYSLCRPELKAELDKLDSDKISNPGPVQSNYESHVAKIGGGVPDVRSRIADAIDNITMRRKIYYDYAKEKLDIAKKIGVTGNMIQKKEIGVSGNMNRQNIWS
ncbi:hypothetical protein QOZ80_9BG0715510 [Eleusine coracana subsp. coracana]|nr:hypothetical protein QOZ80_9BG0715510 [Eleusine coracana subsp. coracana]